MNAPYFHHQKFRCDSNRERRYPFLALIDLLLGWSIGLSSLAIGVYALGRVLLVFAPQVMQRLHYIGIC